MWSHWKCRRTGPILLQQHTIAYNTSVQASIGYEPFLMHGFHAATAVEVVLPTPVAIQGEEPVVDSRDKALRNLRRVKRGRRKLTTHVTRI